MMTPIFFFQYSFLGWSNFSIEWFH